MKKIYELTIYKMNGDDQKIYDVIDIHFTNQFTIVFCKNDHSFMYNNDFIEYMHQIEIGEYEDEKEIKSE